MKTTVYENLAAWTRKWPPAVLVLLVFLTPLARAAGPVAADGGIVFSLDAPDAVAVHLAGDFNGWNATGLPLTRQDSGVWAVSVELEPGAYEYKFVVDGNWMEDPGNPEKKSDPFGGSNSVVTIAADGSVQASGTASPPTAAEPTGGEATAATAAVIAGGGVEGGAPRSVEGGTQFTYTDGGANRVNLAGSFNGWNADDLPLVSDDNGNWVVVVDLAPGEHEYKFVVDGNWVADPENPQFKTDPYGGSNSLVIVGADGKVTDAPLSADDGKPTSNNSWNAKVLIDGRYLTRFQYAKNIPVDVDDETQVDPRYRLVRPTQSIDLNFNTEINEQVESMVRIRLDSRENIIQNNIAGFLDQANLIIDPHNFRLKAYWNQETFSAEDLFQKPGNIDLPGTIMHDHLEYGRGTAGVVFTANPVGVRFNALVANVYNQSIYNDPELYDNTGEDQVALRLSKKFGAFEIGTPFYFQRSLIWLDMGTVVGQPSTGIPSLDAYLAETNDSSTWYETETRDYNYGLDLRIDLGEKWQFGAQGNYVDLQQKFVTGNESGVNNSNGSVEIPVLEREQTQILGQLEWKPAENSGITLKQIFQSPQGANPDQRLLEPDYEPQETANKQIYFTINDSPAPAEVDSTDLTWDWDRGYNKAKVWLRHAGYDLDYGAIGSTVPGDSTLTTVKEHRWYAAGRFDLGQSDRGIGWTELQAGYTYLDRGAGDQSAQSIELIFRYDRALTRNFGILADVRWIGYHTENLDGPGEPGSQSPDFFNPFAGFRYEPVRKLNMVLAYGLDPMDFYYDYNGRQLGRWWARQNYLWDNPGSNVIDAERAVSKARVFTLRLQYQF